VGVCSRGGDQSAMEETLVPRGAEEELFCRSEWEEEVRYSRLGIIRLQLKHLVINKQAGENFTKSAFPFICFLIFLNQIKLKVRFIKGCLRDCLQIAGRTSSCPLVLLMVT